MKMQWQGVIPAMTTPFDETLNIDHAALANHCTWMIDSGCTGVVALGSLGEAATLTLDEKVQALKTCVQALAGRAPVVAGISALSTAEAVTLAKTAEDSGCSGLMVLPPYVYLGDWRETKAHVAAIFSATKLSCMLYNNPVAYNVDFVPEQVKELVSEHANLEAIKESSTDVRRVMALRILMSPEFKILVGVDDGIVEAIEMGAVGWIAGLVNAFPKESVELFNLAANGQKEKAFELYKWFLPLLRMDTVAKFVQLIKLTQAEVGKGSARVRPPRLTLEGAELAEARETIAEALAARLTQ
jgi:dihydrodipicolinate synthase/N-acetylneuraminate lyase